MSQLHKFRSSSWPLLVLLLALAGCIKAAPIDTFAADQPAMLPEKFFLGRTAGNGVLETRGGRPSLRFRVEGQGDALPDGSFRLRQTVHWSDGRTESREWLLRAQAGGRYTGTLTGAAGPVTGEVAGPVFRLRYRLSGPAVMHQHLWLQPGGTHVLNSASVTALGAPVARLTEIIERLD